jgi:hypothetical protein
MTREPNALLAREYHDKEVCGVSFGILPPRVPALIFRRSLPVLRGTIERFFLSSLCLALVDETD